MCMSHRFQKPSFWTFKRFSAGHIRIQKIHTKKPAPLLRYFKKMNQINKLTDSVVKNFQPQFTAFTKCLKIKRN